MKKTIFYLLSFFSFFCLSCNQPVNEKVDESIDKSDLAFYCLNGIEGLNVKLITNISDFYFTHLDIDSVSTDTVNTYHCNVFFQYLNIRTVKYINDSCYISITVYSDGKHRINNRPEVERKFMSYLR